MNRAREAIGAVHIGQCLTCDALFTREADMLTHERMVSCIEEDTRHKARPGVNVDADLDAGSLHTR